MPGLFNWSNSRPGVTSLFILRANNLKPIFIELLAYRHMWFQFWYNSRVFKGLVCRELQHQLIGQCVLLYNTRSLDGCPIVHDVYKHTFIPYNTNSCWDVDDALFRYSIWRNNMSKTMSVLFLLKQRRNFYLASMR